MLKDRPDLEYKCLKHEDHPNYMTNATTPRCPLCKSPKSERVMPKVKIEEEVPADATPL